MFEFLIHECKFHMDEYVRVTRGFYTGTTGRVVKKQFAIIPWCNVYTIDFGKRHHIFGDIQLGKFIERHLVRVERPERPPMEFTPLDFNSVPFLQHPVLQHPELGTRFEKLGEKKPDEKKPLQRGF